MCAPAAVSPPRPWSTGALLTKQLAFLSLCTERSKMAAACALAIFSGKNIFIVRDSGTPAGVPLSLFSQEGSQRETAALLRTDRLFSAAALSTKKNRHPGR